MTSIEECCFLCKNPPVGKCESCDFGKYCSEGHYKIHKNRNGDCQPFKMIYKEGFGRCLMATRDIKTFEIVLEDQAAAWGTFDNSKTYCLACLEMVEDASCVCRECNLPLCDNEECRNSVVHQPECQFLRNHRPEKLDITNKHPVYALITPLRIFSLKEGSSNDSAKTSKVFDDIMSLTSHLIEQKDDKERWARIEHEVLPILRGCGFLERDIDLIEDIIAIIKTNCCGLTPRLEHFGASRGIALFPYFSMINHSCVANCRYSISMDNQTMVVRSLRPITKNDEITIHYVGISLGNIARTNALKNQWRFDCNCERCLDPAEFGTNLQAIRCNSCSRIEDRPAYMLPSSQSNVKGDNIEDKVDVSDPSIRWTCHECKHGLSTEDAEALFLKFQDQINQISFVDPIECWEVCLSNLEEALHPNNYLCMHIKRNLIQLYGNREKFDIKTDLKNIVRKLELCQNYIDVYSKVDNGYSAWKGKVLEEMVGPYMLYNKHLLNERQIDEEKYLQNYKESLRMLKDASKCRQYEPQLTANFFAWCLKDINDVVSNK